MKSLVALTLVVFGLFAPTLGTAAEAKKPEVVKMPDPVVGLLLTRKDGTFANLRVESGNFVVSFYNAKREEVKADASRVIVRFRRSKHDYRFSLEPSADGKKLVCSLPVERPYRFNVGVLFFRAGSEEASETFNVLFNQPMPGDGEGLSADEMTTEQLDKVRK